MTGLESAEDFHARVLAAAGEDGRLAFRADDAMAAWDIYPYELDGLRMKPLAPLADAEPPRRGETAEECWCPAGVPPEKELAWSNERWVLQALPGTLPAELMLQPRTHHDLGDLPADLAAEMGVLTVAIAAAVESLPAVARCQLARYGDGGAHLHLFFLGRPSRMLQLRGSPLLDWADQLPPLPDDVRRAHAAHVGTLVQDAVGGFGPSGL
ncbi:hypothetical protein [Nocardioides sp. GY 10127]|uniref:hypothetical protein n=1 Tax=Nocardioides sp. GY 10127 TaxID=2569762 RepID=UPI0010A82A00|nr:hypothetical protein [Nocardioides sp. GY 10127]TIC82759.1 hypothetical protein E8D37_08710 [Nocardioides sp. GY 10127]